MASDTQTLAAEQQATGVHPLKPRVARVVAAVEGNLIGCALVATCWNRRKAAHLLEISYRSLLYKIKDYNLNRKGE